MQGTSPWCICPPPSSRVHHSLLPTVLQATLHGERQDGAQALEHHVVELTISDERVTDLPTFPVTVS